MQSMRTRARDPGPRGAEWAWREDLALPSEGEAASQAEHGRRAEPGQQAGRPQGAGEAAPEAQGLPGGDWQGPGPHGGRWRRERHARRGDAEHRAARVPQIAAPGCWREPCGQADRQPHQAHEPQGRWAPDGPCPLRAGGHVRGVLLGEGPGDRQRDPEARAAPQRPEGGRGGQARRPRGGRAVALEPVRQAPGGGRGRE
eukprot:8534714-Alexandrium_andersonii.AAC.1